MVKSSDPMDDDWTGEGEKIPINEDGSIRMEEWNYGRGPSKGVPAASLKTVETTAKEGRATPTAFAQPPVAEPPLVEDFDCEGCFQEPGQPHHKNCTSCARCPDNREEL